MLVGHLEEVELRFRQLGHGLAAVEDFLKLLELADDDLGQHLDGLSDDLRAVAVSLDLSLVGVADGASGLGERGVVFN